MYCIEDGWNKLKKIVQGTEKLHAMRCDKLFKDKCIHTGAVLRLHTHPNVVVA